jgi:hypothetical protein
LYTLEWKAEILEVSVRAEQNGKVSYGELRIKDPMRRIEWRENSGRKGLRHNRQARSENDRWAPDTIAGWSSETWAMWIAHGSGSSNVKDARVDIGLALSLAHGYENVFGRCGIFEQYFWEHDDYPIFARKELEHVAVTII